MIAWGSLGIEFVVSLVFAGGLVSVFALGLRLLAVGAPDETRLGAEGRTERVADGEVEISHQRPTWASLGAYLCFAVSIAVVLYGIYLTIPQLNS